MARLTGLVLSEMHSLPAAPAGGAAGAGGATPQADAAADAVAAEAAIAGRGPGVVQAWGEDAAAALAHGAAGPLHAMAEAATAETSAVWAAHCDRIRRAREAAGAAAGSAVEYAASLAAAPAGTRHPAWPSTSEAALLRLVASVYPAVDAVHPVTRAAAIAAAQPLAEAPVATPADCRAGLDCAAVLLQLHLPARRLPVEGLVFLTNLLLAAAAGADGAPPPSSPCFLVRAPRPGSPAPLAWLAAAPADAAPSPSPALLLRSAADLLLVAAGALAASRAAPEILAPVAVALSAAAASPAAARPLRRHLRAAARAVSGVVDASLATRGSRPLALQSRQTAPHAMPTMAPEFEEDFDPDRRFRPGMTQTRRDKEEIRQLQKQHRREMRGAARELRLDAQAIAAAQDRRRGTEEAAKRERQKEVWTFLQDQATSANRAARGGLASGGGATKADRRARKAP